MNMDLEKEVRIRRYLLGSADEEEKRAVEEELFLEGDFVEQLTLVEEELIDDYARGLLEESERKSFVENFLLTPARRRILMIAEASVQHAVQQAPLMERAVPAAPLNVEKEDSSPDPRKDFSASIPDQNRWRGFLESFGKPRWKIALYATATLVVVLGLIIGRPWGQKSELATAIQALNRAYSAERPLEARITGFQYAPFPKTMGPGHERVDDVALNLSERLLLEEVAQNPSVSAEHSLGRFYLAQKEFNRAEQLFRQALSSNPDDPAIQSDLGAALLEQWDQLRIGGTPPENQDLLRRCLEHLTKALELESKHQEARFNRALLYQRTDQRQLAEEEWKKYLEIDDSSAWADEARKYLGR